MGTHPGDDDKQDEENPADKEDQSPSEVVPNSHPPQSPFRSALKQFTAAAKRQPSRAVHRGIGVKSRNMVARDQQLERCLQSEVRRVVALHRSVVENR